MHPRKRLYSCMLIGHSYRPSAFMVGHWSTFSKGLYCWYICIVLCFCQAASASLTDSHSRVVLYVLYTQESGYSTLLVPSQVLPNSANSKTHNTFDLVWYGPSFNDSHNILTENLWMDSIKSFNIETGGQKNHVMQSANSWWCNALQLP